MDQDPRLPPEFAEAPPPWVLKAEAFWFVGALWGKPNGWQRPPPGSFAELEAESERLANEEGAFKGGLCHVQLLRYSESPIGPYDELLFIPGEFSCPLESQRKPHLQVTRIYVSTLASVANGRRNWNVPKHLARFEFGPCSGNPKATVVKVYPSQTPQSFASSPCFAARIKPSFCPIAIPMDMRYSPMDIHLLGPPLKASPNAAEDGLVGTHTWKRVLPGFKGKIKPITVEGLIENEREGHKGQKGLGDGVGFPDMPFWRLGIHWTEAVVTFPVPTIIS